MSLYKDLFIVKICLGLLVSCSAASGQPLLLTGPPKDKNRAQTEVINIKDPGIQKSLVQPDDGNSGRKIGFNYGLSQMKFNPLYILASKQQLNVFFTAGSQKPVVTFCLEKAVERMNLMRINAKN